jgi:hypothetical protein
MTFHNEAILARGSSVRGMLSRNLSTKIQNPRSLENQRVRLAVRNRRGRPPRAPGKGRSIQRFGEACLYQDAPVLFGERE